MKTKNKLPRSYDAGINECGRSLGFTAPITPEQAAEVFKRRRSINHIETPVGFYERPKTGRP